jgi:hypothetical protein
MSMLRRAKQMAAEEVKASSETGMSSSTMASEQLEAAIARRREANKIAQRLKKRSSSQASYNANV